MGVSSRLLLLGFQLGGTGGIPLVLGLGLGDAGAVSLVAGVLVAEHREQTCDHGDHGKERNTYERCPKAAEAAPRLLLLGVAASRTGGKERSLGVVEDTVVLGGPVEAGHETRTAVELAGVAVGVFPLLGGEREVAVEPVTIAVLVQPGSQTGPRSTHRFVGDLDGVPVGDDQTSADEGVEHRIGRRRARQRAAGDSLTNGVAGLGDGDQAQEHVAGRPPTVRAQRVDHLVGRPSDRPLHAADGAVAGGCQHPPFTPLIGLGQGVGQQRQRSGLAADITHQQIDQTGLQTQTGLGRRPFDRRPQLQFAHRTKQVDARLHPGRQVGQIGDLHKVIGPQRDHHLGDSRPAHHRRREPGADLLVTASNEQLLELIDDEHRPFGDLGEQPVGVGSRDDDCCVAAVAAQRRGHPGPRQ